LFGLHIQRLTKGSVEGDSSFPKIWIKRISAEQNRLGEHMARKGSYDICDGSRTTDFQAWSLIAAPFLLTRRPRKAISSDNVSLESSAEHATVCPNTSDAGKR
jgi:hypothetical protein